MGTSTTTTSRSSPKANRARGGRRPRRAAAMLASAAANTTGRRRLAALTPTSGSSRPIAAAAHNTNASSSNSSALDKTFFINDAHPHLWLTEDDLDISFPELLVSIQSRQLLLTEISIYNILSVFTPAQIATLYDTIAQLPLLQKFSMWASQPLQELPWMASSFLTKARGLQSITWSNIEIRSSEEVTLLAHAFSSHPSLRKIALDNVRIIQPTHQAASIIRNTDTRQITLDVLLQAIAKNPRIEFLRISGAGGTGNNTSMIGNAQDSLVPLCHAPKLKELYLWGLELSDDDVQQIAQALNAGPSFDCDNGGCNNERRRSRLQTLSLRRLGSHVSYHNALQAFVQMLQGNFTLQQLQLDDPPPVSPVLENDTNTTDTVMSDADSDTTTTIIDTDTNTIEPLKWEMDFYLGLNKSGVRKALLLEDDENNSSSLTTSSDWMEALAVHTQDLNAIFYLLQEKSGSSLFRSF